jgi:hypothetical protein
MMTKLDWNGDRLLVGDLVFRLEGVEYEPTPLDGRSFLLHKPKRMLDEYELFWARRPEFQPRHVLELGIFHGGSIVFWWELWKPERYVAIDIQKRGDGADIKQWRSSRGLEDRVRTYWGTNQTDASKLRKIVDEDLGGRLDLVIDDASHMYDETKRSFEVLFPLVRPGGLYIIEDWSWGCWPGLRLDFLPPGTELPPLVAELSQATGSMARSLMPATQGQLATIKPLITMMEVHPDFVVLERGPGDPPAGEFSLDAYITRRPTR